MSVSSGAACRPRYSREVSTETNRCRDRQMEGIEGARARGVYNARPVKIDAREIAALRAEGLGASQSAAKLGTGRATVYRAPSSPGVGRGREGRTGTTSPYHVREDGLGDSGLDAGRRGETQVPAVGR